MISAQLPELLSRCLTVLVLLGTVLAFELLGSFELELFGSLDPPAAWQLQSSSRAPRQLRPSSRLAASTLELLGSFGPRAAWQLRPSGCWAASTLELLGSCSARAAWQLRPSSCLAASTLGLLGSFKPRAAGQLRPSSCLALRFLACAGLGEHG